MSTVVHHPLTPLIWSYFWSFRTMDRTELSTAPLFAEAITRCTTGRKRGQDKPRNHWTPRGPAKIKMVTIPPNKASCRVQFVFVCRTVLENIFVYFQVHSNDFQVYNAVWLHSYGDCLIVISLNWHVTFMGSVLHRGLVPQGGFFLGQHASQHHGPRHLGPWHVAQRSGAAAHGKSQNGWLQTSWPLILRKEILVGLILRCWVDLTTWKKRHLNFTNVCLVGEIVILLHFTTIFGTEFFCTLWNPHPFRNHGHMSHVSSHVRICCWCSGTWRSWRKPPFVGGLRHHRHSSHFSSLK